MYKKKIKLAISGALGKMGQSLIKESKNFKNIKIKLLIIKKEQLNKIEKIKKIIKNHKKIKIVTNIKKNLNFDILIDFTNPKNTIKNLNFCYKNNKKIIIGTTGLSKKDYLNIKKKSKKISILYSSNFSMGINLIFKMLKIITKNLGKKSDIEIIESHHRYKKDSPSGTALDLGKNIAKNMKWNFNEVAIFHRNHQNSQKKQEEIGFSSIRAGKIIGKHTIIFAKKDEILTIKHEAFNRKTFSQGAIKAAIWINNKKTGLFKMKDILKI
ncbi:4-hydroxy-tetrahydrodipicolinate reductase [Buchnera aphidicola]|uniref:4-hydroxy-tetrahydrodipicolinate reductase n=1 Tax=Buchnera aphidicola TaxID=9 RepID=UPI002091FE4A|nr:4-hydroxy-tetrahydrodipicolinate reductase [Buchnera aphidicola]USS94231.1 4-hydroxy-tetrahydrodipicolinate reductase [Buchnera aphidicola (Sipha maydis)]WII23780.1 4-hydroxy-tetrahydrodipicolinate reductase [Buchnera aphidicola (Sipha maydis)]